MTPRYPAPVTAASRGAGGIPSSVLLAPVDDPEQKTELPRCRLGTGTSSPPRITLVTPPPGRGGRLTTAGPMRPRFGVVVGVRGALDTFYMLCAAMSASLR